MAETPSKFDHAARKIDEIEAEMKRCGLWQSQPLPPEAYQFQRAFAMDTMAYSQWLQFVFIPRVRQIIAEHGPFPTESSVGTQAIREFDGNDQASKLVSLLCEFDSFIEPRTLEQRYGGVGSLPTGHMFKIILLAMLMGGWVLVAFLGTASAASSLNERLPRNLQWDIVADATPTMPEVQMQFVAGIGAGRPGPISIQTLRLLLAAQKVDNQMGHATPVFAEHTLVETPARAGETQLKGVTLQTVEEWLRELDARRSTRGHDENWVARNARVVFVAIDHARSARRSDELFALAIPKAGSLALQFHVTRGPMEYGDYLPSSMQYGAGIVVAILGSLMFYKPVIALRRVSVGYRRGR